MSRIRLTSIYIIQLRGEISLYLSLSLSQTFHGIRAKNLISFLLFLSFSYFSYLLSPTTVPTTTIARITSFSSSIDSSCNPNPICKYHDISTRYDVKVDLTFLVARLSRFQFQILFFNILDFF